MYTQSVYKKVSMLLSIVVFMTNGCFAKPLVIAHRGNSGYAPENTLASVNAAWQVDSDAVEIDIHLTVDNRIVVIHDYDTERTSGEKLIVAETTFAELSKLDVGSYKSGHFKGEKIPLLKNIIATVPDGKKLFIEIKCDKTVVPFLKKVIEAGGKEKNIMIIAFNLDTLTEAKKQMPKIPMYWLVSAKKDKDTKKRLPYDKSLIEQALSNGIDGLDLNYGTLTEEYVQQVHAAGLKIYVWTVNKLEDSRSMNEFKVNGITTNHPADTMLYLKGLTE
jgi:glycerophosphoryl diester phosphodiesterase